MKKTLKAEITSAKHLWSEFLQGNAEISGEKSVFVEVWTYFVSYVLFAYMIARKITSRLVRLYDF
jgi:hypothetical protein